MIITPHERFQTCKSSCKQCWTVGVQSRNIMWKIKICKLRYGDDNICFGLCNISAIQETCEMINRLLNIYNLEDISFTKCIALNFFLKENWKKKSCRMKKKTLYLANNSVAFNEYVKEVLEKCQSKNNLEKQH
jgi:hypothetical protein